MPYQMTNLPPPRLPGRLNDETGIVCTPLVDGGYRVATSDGWEICRLSDSTREGLASEIAEAIRMARDIGFEQGRSFVRQALGVAP